MATHDKLELKILVLDAERLIRLTVCARLKKAGYEAVPVATVGEAVALLKKSHRMFSAIISDIMMGDMDGFMFRDIVRGIDHSLPFFFMTALDPEEGSGFLKRIISDPMCYYLPKSVGTEVLVKRLQRVVGARRIQQFVESQVTEQRKSLALAAHVQQSMLPARAMMDGRCFYATWWRAHESVSGDLYEAMPIGEDRMLFVLGDIQGHGTNAALVMMAVQAYLRQIVHAHVRDNRRLTPSLIANQLQEFFRSNFADISYMTATICIFVPPPPGAEESSGGSISYITCGASDLIVLNTQQPREEALNPDGRGGLPIGLIPDSVYTEDDEVRAELPAGAVCVSCTDGLHELSTDKDGNDTITPALLQQLGIDLTADVYSAGAVMSAPDKYMAVCGELGYRYFQDDITILVFGARRRQKGIYEATTALSPALVDAMAQSVGAWCADEG